MSQPDRLSVKEIEKRIDFLRPLERESSAIIEAVDAYGQLLDTMRENERLNKWLLSHGYNEICSEDYQHKESE